MAKKRSAKKAAVTARPAVASKGLTVRATSAGYYQDGRRRVGDVFVLADAKDFSAAWMEKVDSGAPATPARTRR